MGGEQHLVGFPKTLYLYLSYFGFFKYICVHWVLVHSAPKAEAYYSPISADDKERGDTRMNVSNTTASAITQYIKQGDTAKEQVGMQTVPHLAFLEKQTDTHVQMILEQVVPKEKAEHTVDKDPQQKEKRTMRYVLKGKKVTAITEHNIDATV